jgi:hypothetical protein
LNTVSEKLGSVERVIAVQQPDDGPDAGGH